MKELKFRAFHKPSKKLFGICYLDFKNKMISSRQKVIGQGKRVYFDTVDYDLKDCELMQFTGLKDVDGKDIFEGDIVEVEFDDYYSNNSFTIDEDEKFIGEIVFEDFGYYIKFPDMCFMSIIDIVDYEFNIKILGNIHQNSELLVNK